MIEGLWIVQYEGLQGNGAGVVVFVNGKVLGGDLGYTYEGTYNLEGNNLTTQIHVSNFLPSVVSVLGVVGDFDLQMHAPLGGRVIQGAMSLVGRPEMSIVVRLTKKADL
jgi:hypothetical protein